MTATPRDPESGAATVQMLVLAPVVLTLLLLAVQSGLWWWDWHVAKTAARFGADAARSYQAPATAGSQAASRVLAQAGGVFGTTHATERRTATTAAVQVTVHTRSLLPGFPQLTLHATVTAPREVWLP